MVAVAALALTFGATRMVFNQRRHREIRGHRQMIAIRHGMMRQVEERSYLASYTPEEVRMQAAIVRYHEAMEQKYLSGAAEPWVELPPDPPQPPSVFDLKFRRELDAIREDMRRIDGIFAPRSRELAGRAGRPGPRPPAGQGKVE